MDQAPVQVGTFLVLGHDQVTASLIRVAEGLARSQAEPVQKEVALGGPGVREGPVGFVVSAHPFRGVGRGSAVKPVEGAVVEVREGAHHGEGRYHRGLLGPLGDTLP